MNKPAISAFTATIVLAFSAAAMAQNMSKDQPKDVPKSGTFQAESPGQSLDDAAITAKVKAAVLQEPSLKSAQINVETSKGTVQLSGFAMSRTDINKAIAVAIGVQGVKLVKDDMILKGTQ